MTNTLQGSKTFKRFDHLVFVELARVPFPPRLVSILTVAMQMETNYLPQLANRPSEGREGDQKAFHAQFWLCIYPTDSMFVESNEASAVMVARWLQPDF